MAENSIIILRISKIIYNKNVKSVEEKTFEFAEKALGMKVVEGLEEK